MKTKDYTFTEKEMIILRDALREYKFSLPENCSFKKSVVALKEQFTQDVLATR